jgi:tetratricopeptide (TPR) repeat protein
MSEDWYGAIESYLLALGKNPSYAQALSGLAECYYALDEYDQALSYVKRAAPLLRGDSSLRDLEGFVRIGLSDLSGASSIFTAVLAQRPNDLDARFGLSLLDLSQGKRTEARDRLEDSLRIAPQNSRALLSLALIAADQGRRDDASALIERALRYHGSDRKVQLTAARLASQLGDTDKALFHARNALELSPSWGEARRLVGSLLYQKGDYAEAIAAMREGLGRDRKDAGAWYTLGLAQTASGKSSDALYSFRQALGLAEDDEVVRLALEGLLMDSLPLESPARSPYADWHFDRGAHFEERSLFDQAAAEYRRGLSLYPDAKRGRVLYAELLRKRGRPARQLAELQFLDATGHADTTVRDAIETWGSLLADSVGRSWRVDQFDLAKRPYSLALFLLPSKEEAAHPGSPDIFLRYLEDQLASSSRLRILDLPSSVSSPAEAFRRARDAGADYYVIFSPTEHERDVQLAADIHVGRTGSPAASFTAYRSGNDRVKDATMRLAGLIDASFQVKGGLVKRSQNRALVDLGSQDGLKVGDKLLVIKKGELSVQAEGLGPAYAPASIVGDFTVTRLDEEVCEGDLKAAGFFDTMNSGDEVIQAPAPGGSSGSQAKAVARDLTPPASPQLSKLYTTVKRLR